MILVCPAFGLNSRCVTNVMFDLVLVVVTN